MSKLQPVAVGYPLLFLIRASIIGFLTEHREKCNGKRVIIFPASKYNTSGSNCVSSTWTCIEDHGVEKEQWLYSSP